jgi:GDP-mannose 6-dehydrogenase
MRISIFGLGYVGAVTAACLASEGHEILGVDVDPVKLEIMRSGQSPIIEAGLAELVSDGVRRGRIRVTDSAGAAVQMSEASLICVGTPSSRNGSLDMSIVRQVASEIGAALRTKMGDHLVIVRSTVLPGTVTGTLIPILEECSGKKVDVDFGVCFNPEFLREGSSVKDFYAPPFTVVGVRQPDAESRSASIVQSIYGNVQAPFITTSVEAAEMIKCACNTFHALKIVFANEIGNLCKAMKIDSHEVMRIFCMDKKLNVSPAYLRPGFAFGGSCLPKDLRALEHQASALDQAVPLIRSILPSNTLQIEKAIQMVLDTGKKNVGLLGLSFKPGTDDLRGSPLVVLAERLLGKGLRLKIYDSNVSLARLRGANKRYISHEIPHLSRLMVASLAELIESAEVLIVGNHSPSFGDALSSHATEQHLVIDLVRIAEKPALSNVNYQGICW